jgi:hypothetical protein
VRISYPKLRSSKAITPLSRPAEGLAWDNRNSQERKETVFSVSVEERGL